MNSFIKNISIIIKNIKANVHWILIFSTIILVWRWLDYGLAAKFDVFKPIIEGVIGGVVTAVLLLVFATLWKSSVIPWLENITYRDAKIEGVWQGFLVPYMGIEEVDRLRVQAAWREIMESVRKNKMPKAENTVPIDAKISSNDGEKKDSNAELILPSKEQRKNSDEGGTTKNRKPILVSISAQPIHVRAEFWRMGHKVQGRLIEIGGASEVHTYFVEGTFRNLILCGRYENENPQNIDRGSFSLMLKENGARFEGFFASYVDEKHKIHPFRCILKRNNLGGNSADGS